MLSRKSKDKTIKEGVVGKYVKKDTPPEIPSMRCHCELARRLLRSFSGSCRSFVVINVWTIDSNKNKAKSRRNSQQITAERDVNCSTNENIIQATSQKFSTNGKIAAKKTGLGHEGKYTPK